MYKSILYLMIFSLINAKGYTQPNKVFSLKQCIETAISNNIAIKQSALFTESANENYRQAKRNQLPDLSANINHGFNQGRSIDPFSNSYINQQVGYSNYNLGAGILLYNGSRLRNAIQQNRFDIDASKMELQQEKELLTTNVLLAYLQLLSFEDQLSQARNQVTLTNSQLQRLDILNKEGAIVPALLSDMKGQLASDQLAVVTLQNSVDNAKLNLLQLMNLPFDKNITVERITADELTGTYTVGIEEIYNKALQNLSSVKAAELRKKSAERFIKVVAAEAYPVIGLNANLNSNFSSAATNDILLNSVEVPSGDFVTINGNKVPVYTQRNNFNSSKIRYFNQLSNNYNTSLSVNLRIPLFNASLSRNRVTLARIDLKNSEYIIENNRRELRQAIEQSFINMTSAYDRYILLLQQVQDFNESFRAAEVRFAAGVSTSVDYLVAKNNVDRANINLVSAKYDYLLRKKILDFYQGNNIF